MRIISRFRDYYDGVMAQGQDASLTYVRETLTYTRNDPPEGVPDREAPKHDNRCIGTKYDDRWVRACKLVRFKGELPSLDRKRGLDPEADDWFSRGYRYRYGQVEVGCVFFCGKQYPFYTVPKAIPILGSSWDYSVRRVYSWEKEFDSLVAVRRVHTERHLGSYREVLEEITGVDNTEANLFFREPIVVAGPETIVINPCLTDYGFQRVLDPFATFQEIAMFIGGVLGQNVDPPSPMTDKEKVKSHGFDPKYGFRTPPGKNKRKG